MWTGTCLSEVTEKKMGLENSFVIGWPTINYVVTFRYLIRHQTSFCSVAAAQASHVSNKTMTEAIGPWTVLLPSSPLSGGLLLALGSVVKTDTLGDGHLRKMSAVQSLRAF